MQHRAMKNNVGQCWDNQLKKACYRFIDQLKKKKKIETTENIAVHRFLVSLNSYILDLHTLIIFERLSAALDVLATCGCQTFNMNVNSLLSILYFFQPQYA